MRSENDHASQANSAAKHEKEADNSPKTQAKHVQPNDATANAAAQQSDELNQTTHVLALPANFSAPVNPEADAANSGDLRTDSTNGGATPQGASWQGFKGSADRTVQILSPAPATITGPTQSPDIASNASQSDDPAVSQAVDDTQGGLSSAKERAIGENPDVSLPGSTLPGADSSQAMTNQADVAASAQAASVFAQNATYGNSAPQSVSPGPNVAAISSMKAGAALKSLQSLATGAKNISGISNSLAPGAKETDSYLSIQKEAKNQLADTKDSTVVPAQHGARTDSTEQPSVAAVVTATPLSHTAVTSEVRQQSFTTSTDSSSTAASKSSDAAANAQLNQAIAAGQTATSESASTVVNSAKLIQSIGQSEMRVGMRTADFGDISIRTSSTRDSISAQISLDHADLAKTLTTHMPEMQTRLSSGEVVDVHIHNEGQAESYRGQSDPDQSGSRNQQQNGDTASSTYFNAYSSGQSATGAVPASVLASAAVSTGRLDIRA